MSQKISAIGRMMLRAEPKRLALYRDTRIDWPRAGIHQDQYRVTRIDWPWAGIHQDQYRVTRIDWPRAGIQQDQYRVTRIDWPRAGIQQDQYSHTDRLAPGGNTTGSDQYSHTDNFRFPTNQWRYVYPDNELSKSVLTIFDDTSLLLYIKWSQIL